jgi:intracellular sulfur oxidation DsrE/DsrF family protein
MTFTKHFAFALLIGLTGIFARPAWSDEHAAGTTTRIVVQINESDIGKWVAIFNNLRNIRQDLGARNVAFAIVVIGPGLDMLMADSLVANEVRDALASGIEFIACTNTLRSRHIERSDLIDGIGYAHSGYVEIVKRQEAGWRYLRP